MVLGAASAAATIASLVPAPSSGGAIVVKAAEGAQQQPAAVTQTPAAQAVRAQLAQASAIAADVLPPLDLRDMRMWNWSGRWHASEWASHGTIPYRYNRVAQDSSGLTRFTLDSAGAPQLQALNGTSANASGLWEVDVTLPTLKDGMIIAPLWIWDAASRDEIDFEFAGRKGLDLSLHSYPNGVHKQSTVRIYGPDPSGKRMRFGIRVNQAAGTIEMLVDHKVVHKWDRSRMSYFVSKPLKPWIDLWPTNPADRNMVSWAGKWTGMKAGEKAVMIVHGYRYTPL